MTIMPGMRLWLRLRTRTLALAISLASVGASSAFGRSMPVASPDDSRIAILHYAPGSPGQLRALAGVDLLVLVPRGEHVQRVVVGDPGAVRVDVPGEHDGLILAALHPVTDVSLAVETEQQAYQLSLTVTDQGQVPWLVRIERGRVITHSMFPATPIRTAPPPQPLPPGQWRVKGDKALLPITISDDGAKILIQWSSAQAIPAVFARDDQGQEQMVNGYMRGDFFVIDRVFEHLVFRIDKASVYADRVEPNARKRDEG